MKGTIPRDKYHDLDQQKTKMATPMITPLDSNNIPRFRGSSEATTKEATRAPALDTELNIPKPVAPTFKIVSVNIGKRLL